MSKNILNNIISITGLTCSGKSTFIKFINNKYEKYKDHILNFSSDIEAKFILENAGMHSYEIKKSIHENKEYISILRTFTDAKVKLALYNFANKNKNKIILAEVPLLFESSINNISAIKVNIHCSKETIFKRLKNRPDMHKMLMLNMMSSEVVNQLSDWQINSDQDLKSQFKKYENYFEEMLFEVSKISDLKHSSKRE